MHKTKFSIIIFMLLCIAVLSSQFVFAIQSTVDLGTAGNFVVLSKSGISTTGTTSITGDIGVSPIDSTAITGFGLVMDSSNQFATSSLVTGKIYTADYYPSTPNDMTTAIGDMETAYTNAAGRTLPDHTELGAGNIGGMTLAPGLYKWSTGVTISTDVTISGNSNDVWIFQIAQDLDLSNGKQIILTGGAQAKNIFWQVAGQTTLGTTSIFNGNILDQTAIVLNTGATLNGRALAQTAVTLDANTILFPGVIFQEEDINTVSIVEPDVSSNSNSENAETSDFGVVNDGRSRTMVNDKIPRANKTIELNSNRDTKKDTLLFDTETISFADINGDNIHITKSNGAKVDIKIMPSQASYTAIARLKLKVCSEENNCTIILKEVGTGTETKMVYQVKAQKNVKVFGLFKAKMNVEANVNAENNEVVSAKMPWWNLISVEAK